MKNRNSLFAIALLLITVIGCKHCPPGETPEGNCSSCVKTSGTSISDMIFTCRPDFNCTIPKLDHKGNEKYAQRAAEFSCRCNYEAIGSGSDSMYICSSGEPRPRFHVQTSGTKDDNDVKCPSQITGIHHGPVSIECFKNKNWKPSQVLNFCNGPLIYAHEFNAEERTELDANWTKSLHKADGTCKNDKGVDPFERDMDYYQLTRK